MDIADATLPLTADLDSRLHGLMRAIAVAGSPAERADLTNETIGRALQGRAPSTAGLLVNDVLDELRARVHSRTGVTLADRFGRSARTIQRACLETLGHGPKWLSRRIRLQEVALALSTRPTEELAVIAAELGYADQSHLTSDFRTASGITPDAYRRAAAAGNASA